MPAGQHATRLEHLLGASAQDLGGDLLRKRTRQAADVERQHDLSTHGVDVAHRVGRGDRAVVVRVIDDWREEIDRLNDGEIVGDPIDRGVVGHLQANLQRREALGREQGLQRAQHVRQGLWACFRGTTGRPAHRCQANLFSRHSLTALPAPISASAIAYIFVISPTASFSFSP